MIPDVTQLTSCCPGDLETVKYLIDTKAADVESIPSGRVAPRMTPIHVCSIYGHTDIMVLLLTSTNVDLQDQVNMMKSDISLLLKCRYI
jgi:ankyrin repeat protein